MVYHIEICYYGHVVSLVGDLCIAFAILVILNYMSLLCCFRI